MSNRLDLDMTQAGRWDVLAAVGEVDIGTVDVINDTIRSARPMLVVDLNGVTFMDSSGLAALMAGYRDRTQNGSLVLVCSGGPALRLLQVSGVDQIITVHTTVDSATG